MTDDMFREALEGILGAMSGAELLAIPGLYEVASEHLNNEVLEALDEEHPEEAAAGVVPGLSRDACVRLLEGVSIECYDEESVEVLREAVRVNLADGTLSGEDVLDAAESLP